MYFVPDGVRPWPDQTVDWVLHFTAGLHGASIGAVRTSRASLRSIRCWANRSAASRRASTGAF